MHSSTLVNYARLVMSRLKDITWLSNSTCDVLIYDAVGSDMIQHCLPPHAAVKVLRIREGLPLVKSVRFCLLFGLNLTRYRRPLRAIVVSIMEIWKPKVIISFIDNSRDLGELKKIFPRVMAISVQNGSRNDFLRPGCAPLSFDHYYSFGEMEREVLSKVSHSVNQLHPVGSLRAGIFAESFPGTWRKEFDLCVISEFMAESERDPDRGSEDPDDWHWMEDFTWACSEANRRLFEKIAEYANANKLTICVAMRYSVGSPKYEEECLFYSLAAKNEIRLISQTAFSSYKAVRSSKLSLTIASTLGYEALGLGERVIIASDVEMVRRILAKGLYKSNIGTAQLPDCQRLYTLEYDEISAKASALLGMTDEEYRGSTRRARAFHMNLSGENPPHKIIENEIAKFLEGQEVVACAV